MNSAENITKHRRREYKTAEERVLYETQNGFVLTRNDLCLTISKRLMAKNGKNAGGEYLSPVAFHGRLGEALRDLAERASGEDAKTLAQWMRSYVQIGKQLMAQAEPGHDDSPARRVKHGKSRRT